MEPWKAHMKPTEPIPSERESGPTPDEMVEQKQLEKMFSGKMTPAIAELYRSLDVMNTNAPISEREGNKKQAKLERENARSFKAAIAALSK